MGGTHPHWQFLGRGVHSKEHGKGGLEDLLFLIQPRNECLEKYTQRARGNHPVGIAGCRAGRNQPPKLRSCLDGQPGPLPTQTACPSAPPVAQKHAPQRVSWF